MLIPEDCPKYESCEAPMCPLDSELDKRLWYPDEEICQAQKYNRRVWIKRQRKIAKRATSGYFTIDMLKHNCIIGRGMEGLDPDKEEKSQLKRWFEKHPKKKPLSEEQRKEARERFLKHVKKRGTGRK